MKPSRVLFLAILLLGVAGAATFHASGALSETDARLALAARDGSLALSPPAPVSSRVFRLGVDLIRLVWAPTGLFRALHLTAGFLLALAAATSALVAARLGAERGASGLAAAILVGASMLFGADLAGFGLQAHPTPVLLALLAGSVWAWTSPAPRAVLGGLLLGLATAEHPFALFLLPGFGAFALQATLRLPPAAGGALLRRGTAAFLVGFAAVFLPILDASNAGLVHATTPHSPLAALAAWSSRANGLFWSLGGPRRWLAGLLELALALWRNAGPLGLVAGLAGLGFFFSGATRRAAPSWSHGTIATATSCAGRLGDGAGARGLVVPLLTLPTLARLEVRLAERFGDDVERDHVAPVAGARRGAALRDERAIDRAAERRGLGEHRRTLPRTRSRDAQLSCSQWRPTACAPISTSCTPTGVHLDGVPLRTRYPSRREPAERAARRGDDPLAHDRERRRAQRLLRRVLVLRWGAPDEASRRRMDRSSSRPRVPTRCRGLAALAHGAHRRGARLGRRERDAGFSTVPLRSGLGGSHFARSPCNPYLHLSRDATTTPSGNSCSRWVPAANQNPRRSGTRLLHQRRNWREVVRTLEARTRDTRISPVARRLRGTRTRAATRAGRSRPCSVRCG
jgi:hypothetical protein